MLGSARTPSDAWQQVFDLIEAGDDRRLAASLTRAVAGPRAASMAEPMAGPSAGPMAGPSAGLDAGPSARLDARLDAGLDAGLDAEARREVARRLPGHLSRCPRRHVEERASSYRLAGAACLESAAEVADWLGRAELRRFPTSARTDAARLLSLLSTRPVRWRAELAVRLARGLDTSAMLSADGWGDRPNWDLAAALVLETQIEPPGECPASHVPGGGGSAAPDHGPGTLDGRSALHDPTASVPTAPAPAPAGPTPAGPTPAAPAPAGPAPAGPVPDGPAPDGEADRPQPDDCGHDHDGCGLGEGFAVGWAMWRAMRERLHALSPLLAPEGLPHYARLPADPLLRHVVPYLFSGLAGNGPAAAYWRLIWRSPTIVAELAALETTGTTPRRTLIDGCAARFLAAGGDAAEAAPFVALWRRLRPGPDEVPVRDFVRLLPSAPSPVAQVAVEELRRADAAGGVPAELFAEAVRALVFRPEHKHVANAVRWLAAGPPARSATALDALAAAFDAGQPAVRERAARLAVKLAPYADDAGRAAVREAAVRLPADLRALVSAGYGLVTAAPEEPPAVPALHATPLPALAPAVTGAAELAVELEMAGRPREPLELERLLAALVELAFRDRDGLAAALAGWRRRHWREPFDPRLYTYGISGYDADPGSLLARCALAIVSPSDSLALTASLAEYRRVSPPIDARVDRFVQQRLREVVATFEGRAATVPVLLATPTSPTGHVDPEALLDRMERLGAREPLATDLQQALLRLPREVGPEVAVRAERLPVRAGRTVAEWLRGGGLPDPAVTWSLETVKHSAGPGWAVSERLEVHARVEPGPGLPQPVAGVCRVDPLRDRASEERWLPYVLPSHREVVAAHLLLRLPLRLDSRDGLVEFVAALAHGDGPVGPATVSTIVLGLGHRHPEQRASAIDALITLAARGQLPAAELGRILARLAGAGLVKLQRVAGALAELTAMGAHAEVWAALAEALPPLLAARGDPPPSRPRPRSGLGELLGVAADAAALAGARTEVAGVAELAARKGSSLLLHEARRLHRQLGG
ncbi:hypothetical protein MF672_035410 [Actinomadura sp. ATCC 31491]|uniref:Secreted protein n=1 Tax=Actinomadura luzonensis TaxID=2805427 RepID=A0ABT0G4C4_9ACTN|nr:hypothetical protein [Actinomadura luzonensis]MCK2219045.1 hypothetical protein [Actinomadura luzonensis]